MAHLFTPKVKCWGWERGKLEELFWSVMVHASPKCDCIFQVQEQALQVARVTKIIDPGTDDTKQPSNILAAVGENR